MIDRRLFLSAAGFGIARGVLGAPLGPSLASAADLFADRVVRLRYLGDDGATLGLAAVSGLSLGGGWVLTSDYGLTADPAAILCQELEGSETRGQLVARDENRRLALIRLANGPGSPPTITGRPARVGETAIVLGRVFRSDRVNMSTGVVSAVDRFGGRAIQTDAAISPVNYGGPLIGLDGSLLGVATPLSPPGQSGIDLYDSGVGFAVPVAEIAGRITRLAAGETIRPGWMGFSIPEEDPLRQSPRLDSVVADGPAERAGLRPDDAILSLAGRPTPTVWSLRSIARGLDAGQTVTGRLRRVSGSEEAFRITLGVRPAKPEPEEKAAQTKPGELE